MGQGSSSGTKTFAAWVEPVAEHLRAAREDVLSFARSAPTDLWERPSGTGAWTCKDLLAHIGKGNDQILQKLLRMVVDGAQIDTSIFAADVDEANAREVAARRQQSADDVIAELEDAGNEILHLLSQLGEEHEHLNQKEPPFILKGFLQFVVKEDHDREHLAQLRAATEHP